jgi:hypothetical protein
LSGANAVGERMHHTKEVQDHSKNAASANEASSTSGEGH